MQLCTPRQCVPHVMGSSLPPHPHPRPGPVRLGPTRGAPVKYAHLAQWHSTQPTPAHQWTQGALGVRVKFPQCWPRRHEPAVIGVIADRVGGMAFVVRRSSVI
jgi:hypothetical protein